MSAYFEKVGMPSEIHIVRWGAPVVTALVLAACALTSDATSGCVESHHGVEICDGRDNNCDGKIDEMAACPTAMVCTAGACTCSKTTCGDPPACADTSIDTNNCGSCGNACKPAEDCVDGMCKCQLPGGLKCGGKCIDLGTDPKNCGSCNHVCTVTDSICDAGVCACPRGTIECDAKCIDPTNDRHNCGTCGTTCDVACSGAKCAAIVQVVAGGSHSCVRLEGGEVRCWGEDDSYELGDGLVGDVSSPVLTGVLFASDLAAGGHHTCAVVAGKVVCWGSNVLGQIGNGTTTVASKPTEVMGIANATAIALGDAHSCARRNDGTVACWGGNSRGELGDGTTTDRHAPVAVQNLTGVAALALGAHHSCALRNDGSVACWGSNQFGELGIGTDTAFVATPTTIGTIDSVVKLRAGGAHTCAINAKYAMFCWGRNHAGELQAFDPVVRTPTPLLTNVTDVALGSAHMCVSLYNQFVCTGNPIARTQIGLGISFIQIAAGDIHTCGQLRESNNPQQNVVACWGSNTRGQCAGTTPQIASPAIVEL